MFVCCCVQEKKELMLVAVKLILALVFKSSVMVLVTVMMVRDVRSNNDNDCSVINSEIDGDSNMILDFAIM